MRKLAALLLVFCLVFPAFGAAKKSPASKKTSSTTSRASTKKKSSKKTVSRRPRQTWRTGQMKPAPERYMEIQQALIDRGYGSGRATGQWNQEWTDGLKRFQRDQKLDASGKLTSLSLLALGLGPRRDTADAATMPNPQTREPQ